MRIRDYQPGDEKKITPNDFMSDWESDKYDNKWALENGMSHTIVDDNGVIQAVVNYFPVEGHDDLLYGWFLRDIRANPMFIKKVKEIVKFYLQNNFKVCTMSKEGPMQDKMHRYLGFEKRGKKGGYQLWVAHQKKLGTKL